MIGTATRSSIETGVGPAPFLDGAEASRPECASYGGRVALDHDHVGRRWLLDQCTPCGQEGHAKPKATARSMASSSRRGARLGPMTLNL